MNSSGLPLLIVEDNPMYAEILQRLLPTLGADLRFSAQWVDTAEKAYEALERTRYDLVLLDYRLPGADGLEVLARIRQRPPDQQPAVIMLTGMGNEAIAVQAMKSGAKDYLAKDQLDAPSLIRAITSALERKRLESQVAHYTEELRQKNEQMEADLVMASEVQQAFLPQHYPGFPRLAAPEASALRFAHRYQPSRAVGGDFFNVLALSDTLAGVFICDVMGNGVRAALVTAIVRALVEELEPIAADPGQLLTHINLRLLTILKPTRGPMFTSAFYLVADLARGQLLYANAGHPDPIHLQRRAGTVQLLRDPACPPGPALGVFAESTYPTSTAPLAANDLLFLFTDGLFEAQGANGEEFGLDRLLAAVRQRFQLDPARLVDELLAEVSRFSAQTEFSDDTCLLGMEVIRLQPPGAAHASP